MARLLTIPAGAATPGVRQRTITQRRSLFGPVSLQLVFVLATTLVGLFYLVQSNRVSTAQMQVQAMEQQKADAQDENSRLQVEAARLQSVQQIKKTADEQKLAQTAKAQAYEQTATR